MAKLAMSDIAISTDSFKFRLYSENPILVCHSGSLISSLGTNTNRSSLIVGSGMGAGAQ